ncbi:probable ATP-dependent RNA helicase DDX41 [Lentinula edodes]|uniref:RNA helicase n=1 Tax=Lentinula edodes TaxID=5353 RepID=A0A1Q3EK51_LENED|nr:probable ATP-dependent RNA helicase DDX41 [Lentinula edodes]
MDSDNSVNRRRIQRSHSPPTYKLEDDDDTYVPYVPVAQRRQEKLAKLSSWGRAKNGAQDTQRAQEELEDEAKEEEKRREKARKERTLLMEAQDVHSRKAAEDAKKTEEQKATEEEEEILEAIRSRKKLLSDLELAKGIQYTESLKTSWRPPKYIRDRTEQEHQRIREKYAIIVEGEDIPPPIEHFADMKIPQSILDYLKSQRITAPTPIQLQGIPTAFSGRDLIGIAFTGSGKTLAFCLPLIMLALEEETKVPLVRGEGPVGVILCPSRELANQTYENVLTWTSALAKEGRYPTLNTLLCMGGISMSEQSHTMSKEEIHVQQLQISLNIMSFFKRQRQTLLFSATMPRKIQDFAQQSLIRPILVNVGRAGAANLDVLQVVEYVKQEAKMVYLLECLQKTPPPVIIFSENKNEVDDIQEYLLLKGVEAVAIHGSKTQEERQYAIKSFKSGAKDVMVASGVASKGLDFNEIQHVIIFSMPKEIEDYVHQIGRTGRSGKTGIATTFVNMNTPEQTLLDLKYLLMEAGQKVPPFLATIEDPRAVQGGSLKGCPIQMNLKTNSASTSNDLASTSRNFASYILSDDDCLPPPNSRDATSHLERNREIQEDVYYGKLAFNHNISAHYHKLCSEACSHRLRMKHGIADMALLQEVLQFVDGRINEMHAIFLPPVPLTPRKMPTRLSREEIPRDPNDANTRSSLRSKTNIRGDTESRTVGNPTSNTPKRSLYRTDASPSQIPHKRLRENLVLQEFDESVPAMDPVNEMPNLFKELNRFRRKLSTSLGRLPEEIIPLQTLKQLSIQPPSDYKMYQRILADTSGIPHNNIEEREAYVAEKWKESGSKFFALCTQFRRRQED